MYIYLQNDSNIKPDVLLKIEIIMKKLIDIFEKNKGFARMKELRESGIQTRDIAAVVDSGRIEKLKPGLYKLIDYSFDENESFATVCNVNKNAVICLLSAASYHELTTFNPFEVYTAVPMNTPRFNLEYPPVNLFYFSAKMYKPGIEEINTNSGKIKVYNKEKTIADLFRYINKVGEDIVLESLKSYVKDKRKSVPKLIELARQTGIYKKMEPYLKGML